jgi:hypothetical protein
MLKSLKHAENPELELNTGPPEKSISPTYMHAYYCVKEKMNLAAALVSVSLFLLALVEHYLPGIYALIGNMNIVTAHTFSTYSTLRPICFYISWRPAAMAWMDDSQA